jgi:hypothetical protein
MIDLYPSLLHHLLQISVGQGIVAVPPHVEPDNLRQKVPPFEHRGRNHLLDAREIQLSQATIFATQPQMFGDGLSRHV